LKHRVLKELLEFYDSRGNTSQYQRGIIWPIDVPSVNWYLHLLWSFSL